VIEVQPRPAESAPAPVDVAGLSRLAAGTGGRVVDPQAADGWLAADSAQPVTVVERRTFDLWHNFSLVLCLCVLMAADWGTRLSRGLV
jgi:hypothetical protein